MGTRNLTIVQLNNEYKIAQYGQWDGYPEGQGARILKFLSKKEKVASLKKALEHTRFLDPDGVDREFIEAYNQNAPKWSNEPDNRTDEQKMWFTNYISRDLGANILGSVARSVGHEVVLDNSLDFAADSLMCEFAYVIDFDANALEVYTGFNKEPLVASERFANLELPEKSNGYYQVKLRAKYDLSNLPTVGQMIKDCDEPEDE